LSLGSVSRALALASDFTAYENFSSYSVGDALNGKTGGTNWMTAWHVPSGTTVPQVVSQITGNAGRVGFNASAPYGEIRRQFATTTLAEVPLNVMVSADAKDMRVFLRDGDAWGTGGSTMCGFQFYTDGPVWGWKNGGTRDVDLGTYSATTTYPIKIKGDVTAGKCYYSFNGGAYSAGSTMGTGYTGGIADITFQANSANTALYFDDIGTAPAVSPESFSPLSPSGGAAYGGAMMY
jgi:hypothetical protein